MHVGAGAGHLEVIHYLHMKGAALNATDRSGDTPLFYAARNGHTAIVNYLTNEGYVNLNAVNNVSDKTDTVGGILLPLKI